MKNDNMHIAAKTWKELTLAILLSFAGAAVWAQTAIESVTGSVQGGSEVVRIDLSEPLAAAPASFSIQSPARIAFDFPGVSNSMGRSTIDVNQGNLRSVSVVQAGERTRVVLNLKQPATFKTTIQGKTLLIILDGASTIASSPSNTTTFAENRSRDSMPIKDLDFRRGPEGSGRVIVTLPNNQVGVDLRQLGQTLVVEFAKSTLPEGL